MATIFFSELGDKTFFLAMILATRKGRLLAMLASISALWFMTAISTAIGHVLRRFPGYLGDQFVVQLVAGLLMLLFGIQILRESAPVAKLEEGKENEAEVEKAEAASDIDEAIKK